VRARSSGPETQLRALGNGTHILRPPDSATAVSRRDASTRGDSVNKQGLVETVARRLECTKARAAELVDLIFSANGVIAGELRKGNKVQISGFGNFEVRRRKARQGRNPRTGKEINIKASTVPAFRAGKSLKEQVNRKR
jgi:DNA-binding protein HU-beta